MPQADFNLPSVVCLGSLHLVG